MLLYTLRTIFGLCFHAFHFPAFQLSFFNSILTFKQTNQLMLLYILRTILGQCFHAFHFQKAESGKAQLERGKHESGKLNDEILLSESRKVEKVAIHAFEELSNGGTLSTWKAGFLSNFLKGTLRKI